MFNTSPTVAQRPNVPSIASPVNGDPAMNLTLLDDSALRRTAEVSPDGMEWAGGGEGADDTVDSQHAINGSTAASMVLLPEGPTRLCRFVVE